MDAARRLDACPGSPNCVCSQDADELHRVAPLEFEGSADQAWIALRDIVAGWSRTHIVREEPGVLRAEVRSLLFRFVDDLHLLLDEDAGVIHVRSASRVGRSDFGVNRRRVEALRVAFNHR